MRIEVTSVAHSEVHGLVCDITNLLEDELRPMIKDCDYGGGVQLFVVSFISVSSDPLDNKRFCVGNNHTGRYKCHFTGETVRFVKIAVPVDPKIVLSTPRSELLKLFEALLVEELIEPAYALPKKFNRQQLLLDLKSGFERRSS